jgi:dienelactone hydrolase
VEPYEDTFLYSVKTNSMFRVLLYTLLLLLFSCQSGVQINTNKNAVILGDNIDIKIAGLTPNESYLVHLQQLKDNQLLYSYAEFKSDEKGLISLDHDEALSGAYIGQDSLGLFSYLDIQDSAKFLKDIPCEECFFIQVSQHERVLAEKQVDRINHSEDALSYIINKGDLKVDVHQVESSEVLILVLGGSEGNNLFSNGLAKVLAAKGYSAAAISYFGGENQVKTLLKIPMEIIDRSRTYIESEIGKHEKVYILGVSRGAELALLYASHREDINGVFAIAPSSYVHQSFTFNKLSAWTMDGVPVPFVPYGLALPERDEQGKTSFLNAYMEAISTADSTMEIPVENIKGNIVLFSGKDDQVWPSTLMADKIEARLEAKEFPYKCYNYQYEEAGHNITPPAYLTEVLYEFPYAMGGTIKGDVEAKADVWQKVLSFLESK